MAANQDGAAALLQQLEAINANQNAVPENAQPAQPEDGIDLVGINEDFLVPELHYPVAHAKAVELEWTFNKIRPSTAEGNFVDSKCATGNVHAFVLPAFVEGNFVFADIPNFPVMTAYFYKGPRELARRIRRDRHLHNSGIVGPLAAHLTARIDGQEFQATLNAIQDNVAKDGRMLQQYIREIQTFLQKDVADIAWMGIPMHISQFVRAIQVMVAKVTPEWDAPEPERAFNMIASIDSLGYDINNANAKLMMDAGAPIQEINNIQRERIRIQAATRYLQSMPWEEWCTAARQPDLSQHVTELQNAKQLSMQLEAEAAPQIAPAAQPQQVIVTHDSSSQAAPISPADALRLETFLLAQKSQDISIEDINLLVDAPGAAIEMMHPGGSDLSKIDMTPRLSDYIRTVQMEMYRKGGHRLVPEIALLKLLTMRFGINDSFVLNFFGHLMFEDTSEEPKAPKQLKGPTRTLTVEAPREHVWEPINTWAQLTAVIDGLGDAVDRLLHPSIISRNDILSLGRALRKIYDDSQARATVYDLRQILKHKLSERCRDLRAIAAGASANLMSMDEFDESLTSGVLWARANTNAQFASQLYNNRNAYKADGETLIGRRSNRPQGVDAHGRERVYKRRAPPGGDEPNKRHKEDGQRPQSAPGGQQPPGEFKDECLRCGQSNHRAWGCKNKIVKIKAKWMDPTKPHLLKIAEMIRRKANVALEYEAPRKA